MSGPRSSPGKGRTRKNEKKENFDDEKTGKKNSSRR